MPAEPARAQVPATESVDWALVRTVRQKAADRLAHESTSDGWTPARQRARGREIAAELLAEENDDRQYGGVAGMTHAELAAHTDAVVNYLFGLGRLQPLIDQPDLTDIEVTGNDPATLVYSDGRIELGPMVADTDRELVEDLQFIAGRVSDSGGQVESADRPFSRAHPHLRMSLPESGCRLSALAWTTHRPVVAIRRHRFVDVELTDLVQYGSIPSDCADFLRSAVRAGKSIVVSGARGHGKTTLARALLNEIPPRERIGTIETEFELFAHEMRERHPRIVAWQELTGSGEHGPDGRLAGRFTVDDAVDSSFTQNLDRLIVGEVRGREVLAMFKAMQSGTGSLSTIHANSARDTIERIVNCAVEAGGQHETYAYRQTAAHIDLIVHIRRKPPAHPGGPLRYLVQEVVLVEQGEKGREALTEIYAPGPDGLAQFVGCPPAFLDDLRAAGLSSQWADGGQGWSL